MYKGDFFLPAGKEKEAEIHTVQKCSMLLLTEFVSHCVSNASPHCLRKRSVSCMVALMSHFPMKEQDFAHLSFFRFFSLYVLSFTMIFFLFNWLVSLLPIFFLTGLLLSEKKTQRGSPWHFFFFIFTYVLLLHSSISLSLSLSFDVSLLPPLALDYLLLS